MVRGILADPLPGYRQAEVGASVACIVSTWPVVLKVLRLCRHVATQHLSYHASTT